MKNRTFKSILKELRDSYKDAIISYIELGVPLNKAQEDWDRVRKSNASEWELKTTEGYYLKAKGDYAEKVKMLKGDLERKVSELKGVFDKGVKSYYSLNPAMLDRNTIDLLEMGIANPSDIKALMSQYGDNITMRRVIGNYANKMSENELMSEEDRRVLKGLSLQATRNTNGQNELDAFEGIVTLGSKCMSDKSSERYTGHKMFDEFSEQYINSISDTAIAESIAIAD